MTKKELVELLEDFDDDTNVFFVYPAGDYWHNTIAKNISCADFGHVKYSEYHSEYTLENDEDEIITDDCVIILS